MDSNRDPAYFGYYNMLSHQQNMLQDSVRTVAYHEAIVENRVDFENRVVLDVGCGSGILSFFAAQAGARRVYAVEAAPLMAQYAQMLVDANGWGHIIKVIPGKIEEIELPEKVNIIISEPMGVFMVHERMVESFLLARDRWLSPERQDIEPGWNQSQLFPSDGFIMVSPFCDMALYADMVGKARFWETNDFFGVDLKALAPAARVHYAAQPIVGPVDVKTLMASPVTHHCPFYSMTMEQLQHFEIKLEFAANTTGIVHGLAGWFNVAFDGKTFWSMLSTAPAAERTHWHQIRLLLLTPIAVNVGQSLSGKLEFVANSERSYDLYLTLHLEETKIGVERQFFALQDQQYWNLGGLPRPMSDYDREYYGLYPADYSKIQ